MINSENLLRCKLALYHEILNVEKPDDLTSTEINIGFYLALDKQVQNYLEKVMNENLEVKNVKRL